MNPIFLIAQQTLKELIRDKILWAFFAAALVLVFASLLLGTLTFTEHVKITIDMGLGMIHFLGLVMSIFLGVSIVGKELRNRSVYSILARSLSRFDYLFGKYIGLMSVVGISCAFLGSAVLVLLAFLKTAPTQSLFVAIYGIFLEMAIVASFTLFMSLFTSTVIASFVSVGWWMAGSFSTDVLFFSTKSEDPILKAFGRAVYYVLPRLDLFQVKNRVVYEPVIAGSEILLLTGYAISTVALLLVLGMILFSRREL